MLFVPVLAIAGAVMWFGGPALRDRMLGRALEPRSAEPEPQAAAQEHHGFLASFEHRGSEVRASLSPLHASAERQAFDASSLARRLGLDEGMPWRLDLLREALPGAESTGGSWPLDGLGVRSDSGLPTSDPTLGPLKLDDLPEGDPLRILLAPDPAGLRPGQAQTVLLWGPASCPDPVLDAFGVLTPLEAETWTARGEDEALLRLEPL